MTQPPIIMPDVVSRYFAADTKNDGEALLETFAPDAVVADENAQHQGEAAIRQWWVAAKLASHYVAEPLEAQTAGSTVQVRARVSGTFPGSPITLTHMFTLEGDKIARLEIK